MEMSDVTRIVSDGDVLDVDVSVGTFRREPTGQARSVAPFPLEVPRAGGLIRPVAGNREQASGR